MNSLSLVLVTITPASSLYQARRVSVFPKENAANVGRAREKQCFAALSPQQNSGFAHVGVKSAGTEFGRQESDYWKTAVGSFVSKNALACTPRATNTQRTCSEFPVPRSVIPLRAAFAAGADGRRCFLLSHLGYEAMS